MKNSYLLLTAVFFMLYSCSSDSETPVEPTEPQAVKLVRQTITTGWSGQSTTSEWSYDGAKLLSIISDNGSEQLFTYEGDRIVSIQTTNEFGEITTDSFEYDNQGRITTHFDISAAWGRKEVYSYQSDGTVLVTKFFGTNEVQNQAVMHGSMQFANGEVSVTTTENVDSGYSRTCHYTYDVHNSPTKNIVGYEKIASLLAANQKGIFHNVLTNTQQAEGSEATIVTKTYEYDSDNYPVRIVSNDPLDGDSGVTSYQY